MQYNDYDIDSMYSDSKDYSIWNLASELAYLDVNEVYKKISETREHSVLYKLKEKLNYDPIALAGDNKEELHKALKIVKLIYLIEKEDYYSPYVEEFNTEINYERKINIIDILTKPRMENIRTTYSENSIYDVIISGLRQDTEELMNDADERNKIWTEIDYCWKYKMNRFILNYLLKPEYIMNCRKGVNQLKNFNFFMEKNLNQLFSNLSIEAEPEGVCQTFHNILRSHELNCYDYDMLKLKYDFNLQNSNIQNQNNDCSLNTKYRMYNINSDTEAKDILNLQKIFYAPLPPNLIEKYKEIYCSNQKISFEEKIQIMQDIVSDSYQESKFKDIIESITYNTPYSDNKENYEFAFDRCTRIIEWWKQIKEEDYLNDNIPAYLFIAIIQELIYIRENNVKINKIFYRYYYSASRNNNIKDYFYTRDFSLVKEIKDSVEEEFENPDKAIAFSKLFVVERIINRIAINAGNEEFLLLSRKAEHLMYEFKNKIFSSDNLEYIRKSSAFVYNILFEIIIEKQSIQTFDEKETN